MGFIIDLIINNGTLPARTPMSNVIYWFMQAVSLLFFIMYIHQFIYLIIGSFKNAKVKNKVFRFHTIGIVISARNESRVIGRLIDSIHASDYPQSMLKIFVIADNCTDNTAEICRNKGCIVFERNNLDQIGKGYALNFLFTKLHSKEYSDIVPEAYIVLDADNEIKTNFITEMNKVYDSGYEMVTSYRNSKNFGTNWITSGYGYWFLHEAKHLNNARMILHTSSTILGTGFLISSGLVKEFNNWEFFMLTEDVQSSMEYVLKGGKIGYCHTAEFYDEQPETMRQSWKQRERWTKGYYQTLGKYGMPLIKNSFKNFSCWDVFTNIAPMLIIAIALTAAVLGFAIFSLIIWDISALICLATQVGLLLVSLYFIMFAIPLLLNITEGKKIAMPWWKKVLFNFTFPFFMATYYPIAFSAMFKYKKVKWDPIQHGISKKEMKAKKKGE